MTNEPSARRRALLGTIGSLGSMALAGCLSLGGGKTGALRVAQLHPPTTLDPVTLNDVWSAQVAARVFDGLYTYDDETGIVPAIAAAKPDVSEQGRRYEVRIDDAARFQNGQPVRAEDVTYSFEAPVREETPNAADVRMIRRIETLDERTVRFTLEYPYPAFEHTLTRPIVPKSVRDANTEKFATKEPIGAGPFKVERFKPGTSAMLSRWGEYWGEPKPELHEVEFVHVESPLTQMMSLKSGRNDMVEPVPPHLWRSIERTSGVSVQSWKSYSYAYVGFNCNHGPTAKQTVRKAIDYCVDLDEAVEKFVQMAGERQYSPLPNSVARSWGMPLDRWAEIPRRKNIERARELFNQADVSNWKPRILVPKDPIQSQIAHSIVGGLRDAGFRQATVKEVSWARFLRKHLSGVPSDYNLFIGSWAGTPDPDSFLYNLLHENQEGDTNGTFYQNEDVMNQIRHARQTTNRTKRKRLYESAITTLLEERAHLPVYQLHNSIAIADRVRNFRVHPLSQLNPRLASQPPVVSTR